jgi:hypothetical protein
MLLWIDLHLQPRFKVLQANGVPPRLKILCCAISSI